MEFHKSLYKSISNTLSHSPSARKKGIKYGRQSKRNDIFQQNRIFSISPTPSVLEKGLQKNVNNNGDKENLGKVNGTKRVTTQQEAYVSKFLAWKKQKELEKQANVKLQKKRPFITACSGNILGAQKSFAPENHKFKAPSNIISTETENRKYVIRNLPKKCQLPENRDMNRKQEKNFVALNKKLVSTPKSKLIPKPKTNSNINSAVKPKEEIKPLVPLAKRMRENNIENKISNKPKRLKDFDKNDEIKINGNILIDANKQKPGTYVKLLKPVTPMTTRIKSSANAQKQGLKNNSKPGIENKLKLPKPNIVKENIKPKIVKPVHPVKKVVSIKSPLVEKIQNKKPFQVQKTPHKSEQKLKGVKKVQCKPPNKINKNEDTEMVTTTQSSKLLFFEKPKIVIYQETPDEHNEPLNTSFVTSTRRKFLTNSGNIVPPELGESILSPIETEMVENGTKNHVPLIDLFVHRQSEVKSKENEVLAVPLETSKSPELNKTPINTKLNNENESTIYVSPYVTLSRGKGSSKKEKKLRESIYILDESSEGIISAELRRVKETVKYFRKMLNDEINRLEARCKEWELYVKNTDSVLLEDYGNDMINVAIGQTRLLINRKFQQFKNLINQCEKFSLEKNNIKKVDDSEKPILPEDLEGFWQMMYIQVDDIDERFRKLERWRLNDWKDPDEIEIQVKQKKKNRLLSKIVKKKKTGPVSTDIRKKLKEMYMVHMERKKQESEQNENDVIIMTPSRRSRKSISCNNDDSTAETSLRRSKRFSTTNITPSQMSNKNDTPSRKSLRIETVMNVASKMLNANSNTPKHNMSQIRLISLIKTPCIACPGDAACSSRPRKSILKTPGTQKKRQTVIFNEEIIFKSPGKLCGSGKSKKSRSSSGKKSTSGSSQKKERKRSLNLRARRLLLDPEAKIEIPTK